MLSSKRPCLSFQKPFLCRLSCSTPKSPQDHDGTSGSTDRSQHQVPVPLKWAFQARGKVGSAHLPCLIFNHSFILSIQPHTQAPAQNVLAVWNARTPHPLAPCTLLSSAVLYSSYKAWIPLWEASPVRIKARDHVPLNFLSSRLKSPCSFYEALGTHLRSIMT